MARSTDPGGAGPPNFVLGLEAARGESDGARPEHAVEFKVMARW